MPTGYTAKIADGSNFSFEDFVLGCAREFGAMYHMRDLPADAPLTPQKVDDFYLENRKQSQEKLRKVRSKTIEEWEKLRDSEFKDAMAEHAQRLLRIETMRERYQLMETRVKNWTPPTDNHIELKSLMLEQLKIGMTVDCGHSLIEPQLMSVPDFKLHTLAQAEEEVRFWNSEVRENQARVDRANDWMLQLWEALEVK